MLIQIKDESNTNPTLEIFFRFLLEQIFLVILRSPFLKMHEMKIQIEAEI